MLAKANHTITTMEQAIQYLAKMNTELCGHPYRGMNLRVLGNHQFLTWPASTKKHQTYEGGLVVHTAQVCQTALAMLETIQDVRRDLVFTAGLWHDVAKTKDYQKVDTKEGPIWQDTDFHETERHLARSYAEFCHEAWNAGAPQDEVGFVSHLMLAHHGRREWGSPVEPANAAAWALHAADMMSARFVV